jgi:hypothetical protein
MIVLLFSRLQFLCSNRVVVVVAAAAAAAAAAAGK